MCDTAIETRDIFDSPECGWVSPGHVLTVMFVNILHDLAATTNISTKCLQAWRHKLFHEVLYNTHVFYSTQPIGLVNCFLCSQFTSLVRSLRVCPEGSWWLVCRLASFFERPLPLCPLNMCLSKSKFQCSYSSKWASIFLVPSKLLKIFFQMNKSLSLSLLLCQ